MGKFKNLAKLADTFLETGETLHQRFKGKSRDEAMGFLKSNLQLLRNPQTFQALQQALQGKSATDIRDSLRQSHKNLSWQDAADLARLLTDEKMDEKLPAYLDQKLRRDTQHSAEKASEDKQPKKPSSPKTGGREAALNGARFLWRQFKK